jgi:hypothetical protein
VGLPQYAFGDDSILGPDDISDDILRNFDRDEPSIFAAAVRGISPARPPEPRYTPPIETCDPEDDVALLAEIFR